MNPIDSALRPLIAELVRDEVKRALEEKANEAALTTRTAAKQASVAPGTIRRWVKEGRLAARKSGRLLRIDRADLDRLLRGVEAKNDDVSPERLAKAQFG